MAHAKIQMTEPADQPQSGDDDTRGPYRIADEQAAQPPTPAHAASHAPKPDLSDSVDRDAADASGEDEHEDDGDDSLPPPIVRAGCPLPWLVIAGVAAALILISWLAGAPQLTLPTSEGPAPELTFGARLDGIARTVVFLPLATVAAAFGVAALAFMRQRPIGDASMLLAKSLAIVSLATVLWLIPSDIRLVKQALNVLGVPIAAALLAVPILRLHPRDAFLATGFAVLGLALLVLGAWVVVWATT